MAKMRGRPAAEWENICAQIDAIYRSPLLQQLGEQKGAETPIEDGAAGVVGEEEDKEDNGEEVVDGEEGDVAAAAAEEVDEEDWGEWFDSDEEPTGGTAGGAVRTVRSLRRQHGAPTQSKTQAENLVRGCSFCASAGSTRLLRFLRAPRGVGMLLTNHR